MRPLRVALTVGILITVGGIAACMQDSTVDVSKPGHMSGKTIEQVQEKHTDEWMAIPGVLGSVIGEYEGKPCILVLAASATERVRRMIPPTVDGYPVVVQYVGEVHALDKQ